jgi:hypothetical protein
LRNNKGILGHHGQVGVTGVNTTHQTTVNSTTNNKFNNLFDKNKTSTLNIKVSQKQQAPNQQNNASMYSSGLHMQTIPAQANASGKGDFQLPHAPGAQGASSQ